MAGGVKAIGSTWLTQYKGKEWPVVLCDDKRTPPAFFESRPSPFLCPAILLGKRIFIWVKVNDLKDFDPGGDHTAGLPKFDSDDPVSTDEEHVVQEKLRRKALKVDALMFEDDAYWANSINSRSEIRKLQNETRTKRPPDVFEDARENMIARTKRRKIRSASRNGTGLPITPESVPRNKQNATNVVKTIETIADSDDEAIFVHQSGQLSDPFQPNVNDEGYGDEEDDDARVEKIRQKNIKRVQYDVPPHDYCTIFVGSEYTPFCVSRVAVGKCDNLSDWEIFEEALGSHIKLYENTDIEKDQFKPIDDYLKRGDFAPKFSKIFTADRLEDTILLPELRDKAAQNVAMVYHTAAKIGFEDVQKLCLRKLRVLDWLSPACLLILARVLKKTKDAASTGSDTEVEMLDWMATQFSVQFWRLVETQYLTFSRVMRADGELSQRVFEKMAANPKIGFQGIDDE